MSAPEVYTAALAAIAARRELLAAGTPGPWVRDGGWTVTAPTPDGWSGPYCIIDVGSRNDAALIVAMHAAFAADTDALEAVLLRHRQVFTVQQMGYCSACTEDDRNTYTRHSWPCPDAQAALTALGVPHG